MTTHGASTSSGSRSGTCRTPSTTASTSAASFTGPVSTTTSGTMDSRSLSGRLRVTANLVRVLRCSPTQPSGAVRTTAREQRRSNVGAVGARFTGPKRGETHGPSGLRYGPGALVDALVLHV